ncbi:MAG TPA: cupin domain-containing protein [Nevskiaceae bacterium]|nr:cupin domain-containing protein [Nevskiaceae bacterium]
MSESKINITTSGTVDLGPDLPGYELQLRHLVVEPGGATGLHSHAKRPGVSYVAEGTLTVTGDDGSVHEHHVGEVIAESRDVTHRAENRGPGRTVLVSAYVMKKH